MKKPKIAEWNYSESLYLNVWYDTIMSDFEGLASKYCPLLDNPKFRRGFVDFILVHPSAGSDSIQPVPNEKGSAAER
jgi:hypothetical protein